MTANTSFTITIPAAGRTYFGIGKNASYRAADRGDIPTIRVGGRRFVPVAAVRRIVGLDPVAAPAPADALPEAE